MTQSVIALDTTVTEAGPEYEIVDKVRILDIPFRLRASIASGDTIVVKGRNTPSEDLEILHTFADGVPIDLYLSNFVQFERTVDGASGDSIVTMANPFERDMELDNHE